MHGLGNHFVVVESITQNINLTSKKIQMLSDPCLGIGFDQLLIIEKSKNSEFDFNYRIFNKNGNEVEQCGNGARCIALFVRLKKLTDKNKIYVKTKTNKISLKIYKNNIVKVNMGEPIFNPKHIPLLYNKEQIEYKLKLKNSDQTIYFGSVSLGNPHCIINVNNINTAPVSTLGPKLEIHKYFPNKVNVGFMQILNKNNIYLRVYERNTGETKSCGSGACAAVAVGIRQYKLSNIVNVNLLGGKLIIKWKGPNYPLFMIGEATHVYEGYINI